MLLRDLQNLLADIYGISIDVDIADYLVTDRILVESLTGGSGLPLDETLFVQQHKDTLDVSLYLNAALLARLVESDPRDSLHIRNLDDFCKALEGVSHFVYLVWNALNDKSITRLELELQAEIDKYLGSRLLVESQPTSEIASGNLRRHLFDDVCYRTDLTDTEYVRYEHANRTGRRYCSNLEERFSPQRVSAEMLRELRAFYRMPQPDKLSHINTVQFS